MNALLKNDKKWLSEEIAAQVEKTMNASLDSFKPHGWRRVTHFLREWGLAAAAITVPVTLLKAPLNKSQIPILIS